MGDFTAVLEAGTPFAEARAAFAEHGQALAWDPPITDGLDRRRDHGGTADSGPLRHRYGGVRDLVVGVTVVLSDGTVAKAGGKVIKNVAGYDLAKLFTGSFGTLGLIATVGRAAAPEPAASPPRRMARATTPTGWPPPPSPSHGGRWRPTASTSPGRTAPAGCSSATAATPRPSGRGTRRWSSRTSR